MTKNMFKHFAIEYNQRKRYAKVKSNLNNIHILEAKPPIFYKSLTNCNSVDDNSKPFVYLICEYHDSFYFMNFFRYRKKLICIIQSCMWFVLLSLIPVHCLGDYRCSDELFVLSRCCSYFISLLLR